MTNGNTFLTEKEKSMRNFKRSLFVAAALGMAFFAPVAQGSDLITGVTATSNDNQYGNASKAVDWSGMSTPTPNKAATQDTTYQNMWTPGNALTSYILFDLGGVMKVDEIFLWQYNQGAYNGRAIQTANIYYAETDPGHTAKSDTTGWTLYNPGNYPWPQTFGTNNDHTVVDMMTGGFVAQYIEIDPLTKTDPTGGISEILFYGSVYVAGPSWTGGGTPSPTYDWSDSGNWGGTAPINGDNIIFAGTNNTTTHNDITGLAVADISFNTGAGAFVNGGNSITLGGKIVNNSTAAQTINHGIGLTGVDPAQTINAKGGNIVINGAISDGDASAHGLVKEGNYSLTLGGTNNYSGATTVSAGTLVVNGSLAADSTVSVAASGTLDGTGVIGGDVNVSGTVNGSTAIGGIVSVNNGGTFAGSGTVTGATTVHSGGVVSGTGSFTGGLVVDGGGKLAPGTSTGIGTMTAGTLSLASGSVLSFNIASQASLDQIAVSDAGGLTINGGGIYLYQDGSSSTFSTMGTYDLMAYSGTLGGSLSNLSVLNRVAGYSYNFDTLAGYVALTIGQGPLWSGADGGNWSVAANWSGAAPTAGDALVYAATGNPGGESHNDTTGSSFASIQFVNGASAFTLTGNSVTLTGETSGEVIINNSASTQTVNLPIVLGANAKIDAASGGVIVGGAISGASYSLTKNGSSQLTLGGANTFDGGLTLNAGSLNINNGGVDSSASAIGTGTLTINGGTLGNTHGSAVALATNNAQTWAGNFAFAGPDDLDMGTGAVTMTANRVVTVNAGNLTVGGAISGSGKSLTKAGVGTLTLTAANGYTGGTIVNAGTLALGLDNALASSGAVTIGGGVMAIGAHAQAVNGVTLTSGSITGNGTITSTGAYDVRAGAISANLTGGVALTKTTADTVVLSGTNSYTGITTITAGVLRAIGGALSGSPLKLNGGVLETNGTFSRSIGSAAGNVQWTAAGGFAAKDAALTVNLNGGSDSVDWAAAAGLNGQNLIFGSATADNVVTLTNGLDMKGAARTITVNDNTATAADYAEITGAISNSTGTQTLTKNGAGKLVLSGTNSYAGVTTVSAGTLSVSNLQSAGVNSNLGAYAAAGAAGLSLNGGTLQYTGITTAVDRGFTLSNSSTIYVSATGAALTLGDSSLGAFTLGVTGGSGSSLALGAATLTGAATLNPTTASMAVASVTSAANQNLTLGGTAAGNTVGAITTLAGTLTKAGTSTWSLTGANTYTGVTTVNGGTLLLDMNAGGSLAAASPLTLGGGTFQVTGSSSGDTAQTMGNMALSYNSNNRIILNSNGGDSTKLTLGGAWGYNPGASVMFDYSNSNFASFVKTAAGISSGGGHSSYGNLGAGPVNQILGYALVKDSGGVVGFARQEPTTFNIIRYTDETLASPLTTTSNNGNLNFTTLNSTYTGGNGGILSWTGGSLANRSVNSLTIDTTTNFGTIDMGAATNVLALTSAGVLFKGANDATLTGGQIGSNGTQVLIHQTGTGTLTVNSRITSPSYGAGYTGNGYFTKDGDGVLVVGGANNYTAGTVVNGGTLRAGVASVANTSGAFGNSASMTIANAAGTTVDLDGYDNAIGALAGGGALGGNVTLEDATLTVGGNNGGGTYAGVISSTGAPATSLIKVGTGTQAFNGANTYSGATIISRGTLALGGTAGSLANTSAVTVNGVATLAVGDPAVANNNGINDRINSAASLTLGGGGGGGTFTLYTPATGNTITQSLGSLIVAAGASTIQNAGAGGTATLVLAGPAGSVYTRNAGGTVNFLSAMASFTNAPTASVAAGTTGDAILVGAFLNSADFVKAVAGTIAAPNYDTQNDPANWGANAGHDGNILSSSPTGTTGAGTVSINSLKSTGAGTITIGTTSGDSLNIGSGMIMQAVNSPLTIAGPGTLTSGNGQDLILSVPSNIVTIGAAISAPAMIKSGAGTLVLTSAASNITGDINTEGTLQFAPTATATYASAIISAGAVIKSGSADLNLTGPVSIGGNLTFNGGTTEFAGTTDTLGNVTVNDGATAIFSGSASIAASLGIYGSTARYITVNGGGTLEWSAARNTPGTGVGDVTVGSAGAGAAVASITIPTSTTLMAAGHDSSPISVYVGKDGTGNGGSGAGHVLTVSGGSWNLASGSLTVGGNSATGGGTGTLNIDGTTIISGYQSGMSVGYGAGSIGYFNMSSGGPISFPNTPIFGRSGGSAIGYQAGGTMTINSIGYDGDGTSSYTITGGSLTIGTVCNDSTATLSVLGGAVTAGTLTVGGANTAGRTGTLNMTSGTVTATTSVVVGNKATATGVVNLSGGTLSVAGGGISGNASGSSTLNLAGGTIKYTSGAATWMQTLTNAYVYPGGVTIDTVANSGTIAQPLKAAAGVGVTGIAFNPVTDGGEGYTAAPLVSFSGGTPINGNQAQAVATFDRATGKVTGIVIANPGQYSDVSGLSITLSQQAGSLDTWTTAATVGIDSTASNAGGGLTKTGTGILTLSGASTYTGDTLVKQGTIKAGAINAIPSGPGTGNVVLNGVATGTAGTFDIGGLDVTINGLAGTANVVLGQVTNSVAGTKALIVGSGDNTTEFAGVLKNGAGTLALTKTGGGTLTLNGTNTYTGATTIDDGTLLVNGSLAAGSAVTVENGGTLGGDGVINGTVGVSNGGHLSPGASIDTLYTGPVTMESGSIYNFDIGATTADKVVVTGTVTLNSTWQVVLANGGGGAPQPGVKYYLFSYDASAATLVMPTVTAPGTGWTYTGASIGKDGSGIYITGISSVLPGDADGNGVVDAADYIFIKEHFGDYTSVVGGNDLDNNDLIGWGDLQMLMNALAATPPEQTPEPATLGLLAIGALAMLKRRRK